MSAPTPATRGTPAGIKLDDGFSTKITPTANLTVSFWEKTVQPPGIDGGDAVETTTMHNTAWRTKAPRHLKTLTDSSTTVAYDPNLYNDILSLINVRTTYTVLFPDGSTLAYFGYLKSFEPSELKEGDQPEAKISIVATNYDPVGHVEAAPVMTSVAGT